MTTFRQRRYGLRSILSGDRCMSPASVYDAVSVRIAEDLGFEVGMFGGSAASLAILGDPDVTLITLSELTEQTRRMSRAGSLPVLVDADHGYGNALNVRRTVEELEAAGAAGLTIEDLLLPQAFGDAKAQLISPDEGLGKIRAALGARQDPALVIVARTPAASVTSLDDAIARAKSYEAAGADALMFTGLRNRAELQAVSAATTVPIVLGTAVDDLMDWDFLSAQRVRICIQGHAPISAATAAVHATLKAVRGGAGPTELKNLASAELMESVTRSLAVKQRLIDYLGLKK